MLTVGTKLGRYAIVAPLGAGGMGDVYRAHDVSLNRDVAIKVLSPDRLANETAGQRFLREARAASALNHPNIITIYETDIYEGMAFIAMEYIPGCTLAQLLASRQLPDTEALDYATQIAEALVKAHAAGIVHRDLKPGNVMITADGLVKVLDFGLAKVNAATAAAPAAGERDDDATLSVALSMPGATLGTLSYMSPEQARGGTIDARSDIFSFGVVLFEMLTRQLPFDGDNLLAVLHNLHFGAAKDIRYIRSDLAPGIGEIVSRCVQKDPQDRYQSASEIVRDLRQAAGHSISAAAGAAAFKSPAPAPKETKPPASTGASAQKRKFTIAAVTAIAAALAALIGIPSLRHKIISLAGSSSSPSPASHATVETTPDNPFALQQQAQAYLERWDVPANLERSITLLNRAIELDHDYAPAYASLTFAYFEKNRLNPDPQWAKQAKGSATRALDLNRDLADSHLAAGVAWMLDSKPEQAEGEFRKAADLDPKSSKPHRWLGILFSRTNKPQQAEEELKHALSLNPEDGRASMNLGLLYYKAARYPEAATAWEHVSKLAPDNFIVLNNLAAVYHMMDRHDDSAAALQRSLQIKGSAYTYGNLGTLRFFQGRYTDAVSAFEKAVDMQPNEYLWWGNLGDGYRWAPGQSAKAGPAYQNAIRLVRESISAHPQDIELPAYLAVYLAKSGDKPGALAQIESVQREAKKPPLVLFKSAVVYELCGKRDKALTLVSEALKAGYALREVKNDPELLSLRADRGYQTILAGLPSK